MIEYYNNLIKQTQNPKHLRYYKNRIADLKKPSNQKNNKIKGKISVYVGVLNQTFSSSRQASLALGKNRNYVTDVIKGLYKNKYKISLR